MAQSSRRKRRTSSRTIDAGLNRIERVFDDMKHDGRAVVAGAEAAEMYQTHGFPPELFETLAAEHNLPFDWAGFRQAMEEHGMKAAAAKWPMCSRTARSIA